MQNISLIFSVLMLMSACTKNNSPAATDQVEKTFTNISYGTDPKQKLDLYLPSNRSRSGTKLIVLIHGGGWTSGDKEDLGGSVTEFKKRLPTYAIANLNYRLNSNEVNIFPSQEEDINTAIRFLISHSSQYNYSLDIVLMGASAGAHLALLQAYKHKDLVRPKAVISFFGPTDLKELYDHPLNPGIPFLLSNLLGGTPSQKVTGYQQSSPIYFVSSGSTPTLILQGEKDDLVPKNQSVLLHNKLQSVNVSNKLVLYPNEGHGWQGTTLTNSFNEIESFLKANVN